ncbi:hypothetical protein WDW37_04790, partial [Bdellovibrionota bacterium FG-1]
VIPPPPPPQPVSWKGAFAVGLPLPGTWDVVARGYDGAQAKVQLADGDHRQINFYAMFHLPPAKLKLGDATLGLEAAPTSGQNRGRPLHVRTPGEFELPPGRWKLRLDYPYWIKGFAESEIMIEPRAQKALSLPSLFKAKLRWLDPPKKESVLFLEFEGNSQKLLILPDSPRVPIPAGAKWRWL